MSDESDDTAHRLEAADDVRADAAILAVDRLIDALAPRLDQISNQLEDLPPWELVIRSEHWHRRLWNGLAMFGIVAVFAFGLRSDTQAKDTRASGRCTLQASNHRDHQTLLAFLYKNLPDDRAVIDKLAKSYAELEADDARDLPASCD